MKNLESDVFTLNGINWKFEVQDQLEIMRANGGKKVIVTLKERD